MANPAELLHAALTRWRQTLQGNYADGTDQRIAVRHLDAITELLNQMDGSGLRTDLFRRYFDRWVELTLHHPHGWQSTAGYQHIDDTALENLDHLGDRLTTLVPTLRAGGLDDVRAYAEAARVLLDEDNSADQQFRAHTRQVLAHLMWCVDNYDAVGEFDLGEAIDRLVASMLKTAATAADSSRWREWLNSVVYPFAVNVASAIPAQALVHLALGGG